MIIMMMIPISRNYSRHVFLELHRLLQYIVRLNIYAPWIITIHIKIIFSVQPPNPSTSTDIPNVEEFV